MMNQRSLWSYSVTTRHPDIDVNQANGADFKSSLPVACMYGHARVVREHPDVRVNQKEVGPTACHDGQLTLERLNYLFLLLIDKNAGERKQHKRTSIVSPYVA